VLAALAITTAQVAAENLLPAGDFERSDGKGGVAGWGVYPSAGAPGGTLQQVKPGYKSPQAVMLAEEETPGLFGLFSRPVAVADLPGREVLFSCYYRTEGDPGAHLSLIGYAEPFLAQEWKTPYLQSETQALPESKGWSLVTWRFRSLPGVRELVVIFRLTSKGKLYLDEVAMRPYPTEVACRVMSAGLVEALPKRRVVEVELTNRDPREKNLQVTALALGENRRPVQAGTNVRVAGERSRALRLNYDYDYQVPHVLRLTVQAADSGAVYEQRDFDVPGLVSAQIVSPAFRQTLMQSVPLPGLVVEGRTNLTRSLLGALEITAEVPGAPNGSFQPVKWEDERQRFRLEAPLPALMSGDHVVKVQAKLPQGTQTLDLPLRRLPPGLPEVGYDHRLRLWVRGNRVFPLGLYGMTDPGDVQVAAQAGFNFVVASSPRASYEMRAAAEKARVGVVVSASVAEESFWQHLQKKWGDSPSCWGWIPYSRPDMRAYHPGQVLALYDSISRTSPNYPILVPLASPSLAHYYAEAADILVAWSLPIPHSPLRALGEMVSTLREISGGTRPVWALIQAVGGGAFQDEPPGPQASGRPPTPAEMEALVYLALIHGADGLVWYTYNTSDAGGSGGMLPSASPDLWATLAPLNLRLRWLTPVLLDGEREALPPAAQGAVEMARWRYKDGDYLIAVNTSEA